MRDQHKHVSHKTPLFFSSTSGSAGGSATTAIYSNNLVLDVGVQTEMAHLK